MTMLMQRVVGWEVGEGGVRGMLHEMGVSRFLPPRHK